MDVIARVLAAWEASPEAVRLDYTNWRGERRVRAVRPIGLRYGKNVFHGKEPHWFLEGFDAETGELRYFAVHGIHEVLL